MPSSRWAIGGQRTALTEVDVEKQGPGLPRCLLPSRYGGWLRNFSRFFCCSAVKTTAAGRLRLRKRQDIVCRGE